MKTYAPLLIVGVLLAAASAALADNPRIYYPWNDTYVDSALPDACFATSHELRMGSGPDRNRAVRTYIGFVIPDDELPQDTQLIESATLHIYQFNTSGDAAGRTVGVRGSTSDWSWHGPTWNDQPELTSTVYARATVGNPNDIGWIEWDVTELVRRYADPDYVNWEFYDFILCDVHEGTGAPSIGYFESHTHGGTPGLEPYLEVVATPEPTSLLLLGLSSLAMLRRR
ncbi:MAG: DNRLRE domain-containing protein [Phycisphaerae bacterium]|jgi:hypothetical protein